MVFKESNTSRNLWKEQRIIWISIFAVPPGTPNQSVLFRSYQYSYLVRLNELTEVLSDTVLQKYRIAVLQDYFFTETENMVSDIFLTKYTLFLLT